MNKPFSVKQLLLLAGLVLLAANLAAGLYIGALSADLADTLETASGHRLPYYEAVAEMRFQALNVQQALTDASLTGEAKSVDEAKASARVFRESADQAKAASSHAGEELDRTVKVFDGFFATGLRMLDAYRRSKADGDAVMDKFDRAADELTQRLAALDKAEKAAIQEQMAAAAASAVQAHRAGVVLQVALLLLFAAIAYVVWHKLVLTFFEMSEKLATMAHDLDLTVEIRSDGTLEAAQASRAFNDATQRMRTMLSGIAARAEQISDEMARLSSTAHGLIGRSSEQSDRSAEMAATMEQLAASVTQVAGSASATGELSAHSGELAGTGASIIARVVDATAELQQSLAQTNSVIGELTSRSDKISSIVQVIKEIADQTNLLALNAAIEAARAGEQGRGFAVVADEVRRLAEKTAAATAEISSDITVIVSAAEDSATSMRTSNDMIASVMAEARNASDIMATISDKSGMTSGSVKEIMITLDQQSSASQEVADKVGKVAVMAEEVNSEAGNILAVVSAITGMTSDIERELKTFRIA